MEKRMERLAIGITTWIGSPIAIWLANLSIAMFFLGGWVTGYSEQYLLYFNTFFSIVSYVLIFWLQFSQNREIELTEKKLDKVLQKLEALQARLDP